MTDTHITLPESDTIHVIATAAKDAAELAVDKLIASGKVRGEARNALLRTALLGVGHAAAQQARKV